MIRTALIRAALMAGLLAGSGTAADSAFNQGQVAAGQVTAAEAAPFLGDWSLTLDGPNGVRTFELVVKVEKEKVVGEITTGTVSKHPITDITKPDKSLVLKYAFDYEGNNVDAVVRLTPAADNKVTAQIDFAGGAYVMSGTAAKKEKPGV